MAAPIQTAPSTGTASILAVPDFPQFAPTDLPTDVALRDWSSEDPAARSQVSPAAAWQGVIMPFASDEDARKVARLLSLDRPVEVLGGQVKPTDEANSMMPHPSEARLIGMRDTSFDILVLEFEEPAHPWVFCLSPGIAAGKFIAAHPHLRSDRVLTLLSRTLHGLCIYSAAEFNFLTSELRLPQFLRQVSIYLAKQAIWLKTLRLFSDKGELVHDGLDLATVTQSIPPDTIWQVQPQMRTRWVGFWPGTPALNGEGHLQLDPNGECWCGKGKQYGDCCLPLEQKRYKK